MLQSLLECDMILFEVNSLCFHPSGDFPIALNVHPEIKRLSL